MTNKEILGLAVNKAQENGYRIPSAGIAWDLVEGYNSQVDPTVITYIIFSHEFAKAFWGNKAHYFNSDGIGLPVYKKDHVANWEYHLREMVLCEEPLRYLEKFL